MPKVNSASQWRQTSLKHYANDFLEELPNVLRQKKLINKPFIVSDIWHEFECLEHLSVSYAFDIAIAICRQAYEDGKLKRRGQYYIYKEAK